MRLRLTLAICGSMLFAVAGCSTPSNGRSTSSYRPSTPIRQYDTDPPAGADDSGPSSPVPPVPGVPASQASATDDSLQGVSYGQGEPEESPFHQTGYRRSVFRPHHGRYAGCGTGQCASEGNCRTPEYSGCSVPQGAYCAPRRGSYSHDECAQGCFVPRRRYCCPDQQVCEPQHHCVQRYCSPPPVRRPSYKAACGSEGCQTSHVHRRSILERLFCCFHKPESCGTNCGDDSCGAHYGGYANSQTGRQGSSTGPRFDDSPSASTRKNSATGQRAHRPTDPEVPAVPDVPDFDRDQPGQPQGVKEVPAPPAPAQAGDRELQPMPSTWYQPFNRAYGTPAQAASHSDNGWQEPSAWPRLGIPSSQIAVEAPRPSQFPQINVQPAGWGR